MKTVRADHLGMCFGVRDAIASAKEKSKKSPVTVYGELVHNQQVLEDLESFGITVESDLNRIQTTEVLITAHGASEKRLKQARQRGFNLTETTCPLVHFAHDSLKKLMNKGYFPVIIGQKNHVEVLGITEDLSEFAVVLNEKDVTIMPKRSHYGIIAQTTQPTDRVYGLVNLIRKRFPQSEVQFEDTICRPTKQRQSAAENLARKCSIVIVIGGSNSNNAQELVRTCSRFCKQVHKIQHAGQIREEWFNEPGTVGITAGTSTPDATIDQVEQKIKNLTGRLLGLVTT